MGNLPTDFKYLDIKDDIYSYEGTIANIMPSGGSLKLCFKSLPNKYFYYSDRNIFPKNIQIGSLVKITYEERIVKSYSYFWVKTIVKINIVIDNNTLRNRKEDKIEESPKIKCDDCGNYLLLKDFRRCDSIVQKSLWNKFSYCNKCESININESIKVEEPCIREFMICDECDHVRKI